MREFVIVTFWLLSVSFFLKLLIMALSDYPRTQTFRMGVDLADAIIKIPFILWCAYLLWGN